MKVVGVGIGVAALFLLLIVLGLVVFFRQKKKRIQEKETADFNPVYATYEVHADPVAEVKKLQTQYFYSFISMLRKESSFFFRCMTKTLTTGRCTKATRCQRPLTSTQIMGTMTLYIPK